MFVLILGANGMLGREIGKHLSINGIPHMSCSRHEVDVTSELDVFRAFKFRNITHVINCAAYTDVARAEDEMDLALTINRDATAIIANACNRNGASLIHFSTDYVFDGCKSKPYSESDTPHPLNWYGETKFKSEQAVIDNCNDYAIFRLQWLYGRDHRSFIYKVLNYYKDSGVAKVVDDQFGSPCTVNFVAYAITVCLFKWANKRNGVYHLTHDDACSWFEYTRYVFDQFGARNKVKPIQTEDIESNVVRPQYCVMNNSKIKNVFGLETLGSWRGDALGFVKENIHDFNVLDIKQSGVRA